MTAGFHYKTFLRLEFDRRKKINARYSVRAFARFLHLDPTYLSKVLNNKITLSIGAAQKITKSCKLSNEETQLFMLSVANDAAGRALSRHGVRTSNNHRQNLTKEIDNDSYTAISDMLHYLILEATYLEDFQPDARWIARRFGVTALEVEQALTRLFRLGLLESVGGSFKKTDRHIMTKDTTKTTPALKESQQQILKSALRALKSDSLERRSATGMTMTIDPAKLPIAKEMILTFTNKLCEFLESGERKEVYQLSMNLFSLEQHYTSSSYKPRNP